MLITATGNNFIICTPIPLNRYGRKFTRIIPSAQKKDLSEKTTDQLTTLQLKFSKKILAQSAVAILGLGFVDAGYSGDWSRIGVISKGSEDLLKLGAFVVVPLCLLFIFSFSKKIAD